MKQTAIPAAITYLFAISIALIRVPVHAQEQFPREVSVLGIASVIAADTQWQLAWAGTNNADGIVAAPDGGILFAQEQANQIGKLDSNDNYSVFLTDTHAAGSLSIDSEGRILAVQRTCTDPGRRTGGDCLEPTMIGILTPDRQVLTASYGGNTLGRLNDLVADKLGGAYFTVGGAFYTNADGEVVSLGDNWRTNGIMLSPNEKTLYVTNRDVVVAFDVGPDGSTANRRAFAKLEAGGNGDGMAVDDEGRLYVTSSPGVQVFSPDGGYLGLIPTPRRPITVAFAGPDKRTLYIVGSGAALGPDGTEFTTPEGVRNNAKTIYKISMLAEGFGGRAK